MGKSEELSKNYLRGSKNLSNFYIGLVDLVFVICFCFRRWWLKLTKQTRHIPLPPRIQSIELGRFKVKIKLSRDANFLRRQNNGELLLSLVDYACSYISRLRSFNTEPKEVERFVKGNGFSKSGMIAFMEHINDVEDHLAAFYGCLPPEECQIVEIENLLFKHDLGPGSMEHLNKFYDAAKKLLENVTIYEYQQSLRDAR